LEETRTQEAITLRAVARAVGIAAPSIYAHFPNRDAVLDQLVIDGFAEFTASLQAAVAGITDPVERLHTLCLAYLAFAANQPSRYRILFDQSGFADPSRGPDSDPGIAGQTAFSIPVSAIADCAAAGRSTSVDHFADATALWVALHGLATLSDLVPNFPWPDQNQLVTVIADRLAQVGSPPKEPEGH
jgi:AcrR family transcriptional regulator